MLKILRAGVASCLLCLPVAAQAPEPPITDTRLSVHTLVREDVFAGFLQNDTARLARAERNLELLLASRPASRAALLAWQGNAVLVRAVLANEAGRSSEYAQQYARAREIFAEAMRVGPEDVGVFAVTGGSSLMLAPRLPASERAETWEQAYAAYQRLWALQSAIAEKLPLHHKGELLAGLAESAQYSGRQQEADEHLDRVLRMIPDTPYGARARQWKENPASRAGTRLTCQTCHAPGMLAARLAEVAK